MTPTVKKINKIKPAPPKDIKVASVIFEDKIEIPSIAPRTFVFNGKYTTTVSKIINKKNPINPSSSSKAKHHCS